MVRRYRKFRRINLTAKVAKFIRESLVDKTFTDHFEKCMKYQHPPNSLCSHLHSRSMHVARLVESGITVGKKRGHLDIECPWLTNDPEDRIALLDVLVKRLAGFASTLTYPSTQAACLRACEEIDAYAHRNAMEVIAEAALD